MATCDSDPEALALYAPDDNLEAVRFSRHILGTDERLEIDHRKMAEIICMQGGGYPTSMNSFEAATRGEAFKTRGASVTETYAIHELLDADKVTQNNQTALREWDALCARGLSMGKEGKTAVESSQRHKDDSCWKRVLVSINLLKSRLDKLEAA